MKIKINKNDMLQNIGIIVLFCFFYLYSAGKAVVYSKYYSVLFNVASIIALIMLMKNKRFFSENIKYYAWQIVFIFFVLFTALYTINQSHVHGQMMSLIKIVYKVSVVTIICKDFEGVKKLLKAFSFLGGAIFITLLFTGNLYENWRLGTELVGNANTFALLITVFATGAMFYVFSNEKNSALKKISIIFLICDVYMLLLSGGRKFLLYLLVFLFVTFLISKSGKIKIKNIIISTVIISIVCYIGYRIIMDVDVLYQAIGVRLIKNSSDKMLGVSDQSNLMLRGIKMFFERPLLGWGVGGFQQYSLINHGAYVYAHSNYVELLADFGIVGLLIYYSQYIYCIYNLFKLKMYANTEELKFYLPLFFSVICIEMFSITFNQTAFIPLFIMLISQYVETLNRRKNEFVRHKYNK